MSVNSTTSTNKRYLAPANTDGTVLGDSASDPVGFHGATPTAQRTNAAQAAVTTTGATSTTPFGFATAAQADALVALANEMRAALVAKGIILGS